MKAVMKATLILQLNDKLLQTVEGMLQRDIIYGSKFYGDQRKVNKLHWLSLERRAKLLGT